MRCGELLGAQTLHPEGRLQCKPSAENAWPKSAENGETKKTNEKWGEDRSQERKHVTVDRPPMTGRKAAGLVH